MRAFDVTIGPVHSRIESAFPDDLRTYLYDAMAVLVDGARFMPAVQRRQWDGKIRFFSPVSGTFYTGLLTWVNGLLRLRNAELVPLTHRLPSLTPRIIELPSKVSLRDYQEDIVQMALTKRRGIVQAAVNAGKSEMALEIIRRLRLRTLYVVPSKELFKQFTLQVKERLPHMPLGFIKAGTFSPGLLTIGMIQSIVKLLEDDRQFRDWLKGVEVLMEDEVHRGGSPKWSNLFKAAEGAQYRFGLSATPLGMGTRRDTELIGLTGPVFSSVTTQQLVQRGLSTRTHVTFITYETTPGWLNDIPNREHQYIYRLAIQENDDRAVALFKVLLPHLKDGRRCCIFVWYTEHGDELAAIADALYAKESSRFHPVTLYGTDSDRRRKSALQEFRDGTRPLLITTLLKEGMNIKEMDVLALAGGHASEIATVQQSGRVLRTRKDKPLAYIYDFIDAAHRLTFKHTMARHGSYKSEGFSIGLIDMKEIDNGFRRSTGRRPAQSQVPT